MHDLLFKGLVALHRLVRGVANRVLDRDRIRPRNFSNVELRRYAPQFGGSVINISGWRDEDGQGGRYKDYFSRAKEYAVSNVGGQGKGFGAAKAAGYPEVELDLLKEVPEELKGSFDVVFNHTTLEHLYDFTGAFRRLCELSRDAVIIVVPVLQQIHHTADFGDYWRPTTFALAKLFLDNGLTPVVLKCNDQPFAPIYCFAVGVRKREMHPNLAEDLDFEMGAYNWGSSLKDAELRTLLKK